MKALKHTRTFCIGGMAMLAAGSLVIAAMPANAQNLSATSAPQSAYTADDNHAPASIAEAWSAYQSTGD